MKVNGRHLDVRNESILVEHDRTTTIVCHEEAIRQELATSPQHVFRKLLLFHVEVLGSNFLTLSLFCSVSRLGTSLLK